MKFRKGSTAKEKQQVDSRTKSDSALARNLQAEEDSALARTLQTQQLLERRQRGGVVVTPPIVRGVDVTNRTAGTQRPHAARPQAQRSTITPRPEQSIQSSAMDDGILHDSSLIHVLCEIHGRVAEMMVDTGAQTSVISAPLMRTLGLAPLLDVRFQGVAAGVGRARILGRIRQCPVQIGQVEFLLHFIVLDIPEPNLMILGIDQMKRFQCVIDLGAKKLIFGGRDGVEVDFLPVDDNMVKMRERALEVGCPVS